VEIGDDLSLELGLRALEFSGRREIRDRYLSGGQDDLTLGRRMDLGGFGIAGVAGWIE